MAETGPIGLDVMIFGGGGAGLWLLDELLREGYSVLLLEAGDLGSGQTIASQGIIHGGFKYTLGGLFTRSASAIREMPQIWRKCLAGEADPSLRRTKLRSPFCFLWQTSGLTSRAAMIGARTGLHIAPVKLPRDERPEVLAECPGVVARLDEQVIEPTTYISDLADRNRRFIMKIDVGSGLECDTSGPGRIELIRLINPGTGEPMDFSPRQIILTAGAGNADLRAGIGLSESVMQRRPLHMVMLRGNLPQLNGHCVDGLATRMTVTSTADCAGRTVWQIGGQIAEKGEKMNPAELISHTSRELADVLPALVMRGVEWSTYRVDRAEPVTKSGRRPEDVYAKREGNTITAWPTKLALVPQLTSTIKTMLDSPEHHAHTDLSRIQSWPRPDVALPPWETEQRWYADH